MNKLRVYRLRQNRRFPTFLKVLIILVLLVGAAFCLAFAWQTTEEAIVEPVETDSPPAETALVDSQLSEAEPATAAVEEPVSAAEGEEESELSEPEPEAGPTPFEGAVPESPLAPASYFDDALFLGDSISTGIPLYHVADNAAVVAFSGINPNNINFRECIDVGEEQPVTILEAAKQYGERGKVYILLGGNGTGFTTEAFVEGYETFVDSVIAQYPNAIIYLQSMTPVVADYQNELNPNLNNQTIDELNLEILAIAKRKNIYYLDIASVFKDENGDLPREASPVDGLHFIPEYYTKWFEYLRRHTIATEETS